MEPDISIFHTSLCEIAGDWKPKIDEIDSNSVTDSMLVFDVLGIHSLLRP